MTIHLAICSPSVYSHKHPSSLCVLSLFLLLRNMEIQKGGGESLVRGFADGIGGVFTAPIKEARTGGIGGFFKGK